MSDLRNKFLRFMEQYADELDEARKTQDFKRPFGEFVRKEIVEDIREIVDPEQYYVKGSVGAGRWTDVPWIAVFDKRITKSAQKGVYIVYLLNKTAKELYLTLNQGATDVSQSNNNPGKEKLTFTGIASANSAAANAALKERAYNIRQSLDKKYTFDYAEINTGSKAYDSGCVFYKKYTVSDMPDEETLQKDLKKFLEIYQSYYENIYFISGTEVKEENKDDLEQEWLKYTDQKDIEDVEPMQITVKEAVEKIKSYIAAKGFSYNDGLIENFYLSLKSKPFVILAGTSGTGKTRLVKLFAEAISAKYKMIAVRPDWSDSSDLFGHVDLNGNYIPGAVLEFIAEAGRNPDKPYILCLDEMNLARVEYYLSDFLSVIETRDFDGDKVISDPLVSNEKYGSDEAARSKYGEIGFPENFYLVGTVNMDETTFPFSKKVLDRANTIEFNYVDLNPQELSFGEAEKQNLPNSFLRTQYLLLGQCEKDVDYVKTVSAQLQKINELLQQANAHVGYRIRDEIVFYMLNNRETELLSEDDAFDNEIMQKILPRIQGSSVSVKDMLCELFKEFVGDYEGYQTQSDDTASMMLKKLKKDGARYPKSAEKTAFMVRRFEEDGFTSYWL